jgi:hypothetical protein
MNNTLFEKIPNNIYNTNNDDEINDIINNIKHLTNLSFEINQKIQSYQTQLFNICRHDWCIDNSYVGEKRQYQCRKCKLYR